MRLSILGRGTGPALERAEKCLDDAEQCSTACHPFANQKGHLKMCRCRQKEKRLISGYIATVRAHYALTNERSAIEQAQKALRLLPDDRYFTRGTAAIALGAAHRQIGDISSAEQAFAECATNAFKGGYPLRASSALCYVGMQRTKQAKLLKAQEAFREALALSQGPGKDTSPTWVIHWPNWANWPVSGTTWTRRTAVSTRVNYCLQLGHVDLLAQAYVARGVRPNLHGKISWCGGHTPANRPALAGDQSGSVDRLLAG